MTLNQFGTRRQADVVLDIARAAETDDCVFTHLNGTANGYVYVWHVSRRIGAHRLVCMSFHGDPPEGDYHAAHSCGHKACVNPRHLRWATRAENFADEIAHGTRSWGEHRPLAKVTNADALELRRRYQAGEITARDIANITGLNITNAHMLAAGRSYRDVQQACGWPS